MHCESPRERGKLDLQAWQLRSRGVSVLTDTQRGQGEMAHHASNLSILCVHARACVCAGRHIVCTCMRRPEVNLRCHSPGTVHLVFQGRVSHQDLRLTGLG